jgi:hypothetical protein
MIHSPYYYSLPAEEFQARSFQGVIAVYRKASMANGTTIHFPRMIVYLYLS